MAGNFRKPAPIPPAGAAPAPAAGRCRPAEPSWRRMPQFCRIREQGLKGAFAPCQFPKRKKYCNLFSLAIVCHCDENILNSEKL
jgi:hypothetical protein